MRTAAVLSLLPLAALAAPSKRAQPAPLLKPRGATLVADRYIIKFKGEIGTESLNGTMSSFASDPDHMYTGNFHGFASILTASELEALQYDDNVEYIEQDAVITTQTVQQNADWGLARLSNPEPGSTTYTYDASAGAGTCAYIVDTGIDTTHPQFEGRAKWLANFADNNDTDGAGHGTHVAGTIGSATYGVAKKTALFAVKVLGAGGSGTNADVIKGMDFVTDDAPARNCSGVVVNMSLGGSTSSAVNQAAAAIVSAGYFLGVAAGNSAEDASLSSPASEKSVCTVGATTISDSFASYSNFGSLVDILAPGSNIKSTWPGNSTNTISGTSMATPHIVGLAAYLLGLGGSIPTEPTALCSYIASTALSGAVSGVPNGTVNLLANNGLSNGTAIRRAASRPMKVRHSVRLSI